MPFDGSGNFNRVRNWVNDAAAGIKIKADFHDSEDNNLASGLSNTIAKDGQSQPTADIPLNGHKLTNVGAPTVPTDAATKGYADAIRSFNTAISLTGAVPEARVGFSVADIGFGARVAGTPAASLNRFVWNDKPDLSGADIATLTDTGKLVLGNAALPDNSRSMLTAVGGDVTITGGATLSFNAYLDTVSAQWEAFAAGWGLYAVFNPATGAFQIAKSTASVAAGAQYTMGTQLLLFDAAGAPSFLGNITAAGGGFVGTAVTAMLATAASGGNCYLRPNGTASSSNQFVVAPGGNVLFGPDCAMGSGAAGRYFQFSPNYYLQWNSSGGNIDVVSNAAVAATFTPGGNFTITGATGTKSTGTTWANPSDIRMKNVGGDYPKGLAELLQVQPKVFTFKENPDLGEVVGMIAQEVEPVFPECVTQGPGEIDGQPVEDLRSFDASPMIFALINAVHDLSAKLDAANTRIAALEAP